MYKDKLYKGNTNTFVLNLLNPYGIWNNANAMFKIIYPDYPKEEKEEIEAPEIDIDFFLTICPQLERYFDGETIEDSFLYPIYQVMLDIAKSSIPFSKIRQENRWKRLISLYLGHHLEKYIELVKDEKNRNSLDSEEKTEQQKDKKENVTSYEMFFKDSGEYSTTLSGRLFWTSWKPIAKYFSREYGGAYCGNTKHRFY